MKYIILDSSSAFAQVCAVNENLICYESGDAFNKASEVLLSMLDKTLKSAGLTLEEAEFIACCVGPGSFTGIRIALSSARAFAHSLNKKIVPFTSTDILAYNGRGDRKTLCLSDAGNGFLYGARYDNYIPSGEPFCIKEGEFEYALGDAEEVIADTNLSKKQYIKDAYFAPPNADALIKAALSAYSRNGAKEYTSVEPIYIRSPQAEESRRV